MSKTIIDVKHFEFTWPRITRNCCKVGFWRNPVLAKDCRASSHVVFFISGEGHKEQLPMVLKVPRIIRSALLICQRRDYSLLGFGDILVPG